MPCGPRPPPAAITTTPTTDTKADDSKGSPKTADPGVALYAALSLLSLTGLTCTTKKR